MTENTAAENVTENENTEEEERKALLARAELLGIGRISPKISLEKLREKVNAAVTGSTDEEAEEEPEDEDDEDPYKGMTKAQKDAAIRKAVRDEQLALVRVKLVCMNQAKQDYPGETFTVANRFVGTVKRAIPFGPAAENGWHIERILLEHIKDKKFLQARTRQDPTTKQLITEQKMMPEFSIVELPPLTPEELKQLQIKQAAANGISA